jgi:hypothetical protein
MRGPSSTRRPSPTRRSSPTRHPSPTRVHLHLSPLANSSVLTSTPHHAWYNPDVPSLSDVSLLPDAHLLPTRRPLPVAAPTPAPAGPSSMLVVAPRSKTVPAGLPDWYVAPPLPLAGPPVRPPAGMRVPRWSTGPLACDDPPRKIPYYRLNQFTLVIKR